MCSVRVTTVDPDAVREVGERARHHDGFDSLGDSIRLDVDTPGRGSFEVLAASGDRPVAVAHVTVTEDREQPHRELGLAAAPEARDVALLAEVLAAALAEVGDDEQVVAWFPGAPRAACEAAATVGFVEQRRLHRMEGALDDDLAPRWPPGIDTRSFETSDAPAWLAVNNRAFAGHPEQGGWTEATLRRRMDEPWFDPAGFLLAFRGDALAGFCWTKQHPGGVGEIYVVAADPAHAGGGLGRALVVGGLASLRARGSTSGMLYVDAGNEPAVGLYRSLGFEVVRTDVAYVREAR